MKILNDVRFLVITGIVSLLIATLDMTVQGKKYDFDLQSLSYLSVLGWVFFSIFLLCFVWLFVGLIAAIFRQITK